MTNRMPRVLVVEDEQTVRHLIRLNLQLEGFEVFTAVDGADCLEQIEEVQPDVVTLDLRMPRVDGWDTLTRLRSRPDLNGVRVVLLTAAAQGSDRRRGAELGVDAYLTKPFDPAELISTVRLLAPPP